MRLRTCRTQGILFRTFYIWLPILRLRTGIQGVLRAFYEGHFPKHFTYSFLFCCSGHVVYRAFYSGHFTYGFPFCCSGHVVIQGILSRAFYIWLPILLFRTCRNTGHFIQGILRMASHFAAQDRYTGRFKGILRRAFSRAFYIQLSMLKTCRIQGILPGILFRTFYIQLLTLRLWTCHIQNILRAFYTGHFTGHFTYRFVSRIHFPFSFMGRLIQCSFH